MGDHRGLLSRAEGCWTFDARDRMPRSSRLPVHAIIVVARNATDHDAVTLPRERVRSSARRRHRRPSLRTSALWVLSASASDASHAAPELEGHTPPFAG